MKPWYEETDVSFFYDHIGEGSPFFPVLRRGDIWGQPRPQGAEDSDPDSSPRPYLTLEERMAARGWRWRGSDVVNAEAGRNSSSDSFELGSGMARPRVPPSPYGSNASSQGSDDESLEQMYGSAGVKRSDAPCKEPSSPDGPPPNAVYGREPVGPPPAL